MAIISIAESGLLFEPPPGSAHFRLETAPEFKRFKSIGVCEMDFGWCGSVAGGPEALWLIEVRDYSAGREMKFEHLKGEFVEKAKDCLLVLGSVWHRLPQQEVLRPCLPAAFHVRPTMERRLKLAFVVKVDDEACFRARIQPVQDALRNRVKGQCELLGVHGACDILLMDHTKAIEAGLPLRLPTEDGPPRRARRKVSS